MCLSSKVLSKAVASPVNSGSHAYYLKSARIEKLETLSSRMSTKYKQGERIPQKIDSSVASGSQHPSDLLSSLEEQVVSVMNGESASLGKATI